MENDKKQIQRRKPNFSFKTYSFFQIKLVLNTYKMSKFVKKESGVSQRNKKFVQNILDDLRAGEDIKFVHIARVMKKLGNGRVEVFYVKDEKPIITQAVIRGSFRGKGKHSVWIDVGSIVAICETGVVGSMSIEIAAVIAPENVKALSKEMDIDRRIINPASTYDTITSNKALDAPAFEFDATPEEPDVDVDNI